ncbi:hypothetical protein AALP_AA1G298200 [Arabis alpina]|uniref:DUF4228 domain-containing protein n=1 Tax=Arabis alpina TaxID=50452 RepID=A0A087HRJ9_ARAAL|nr:hypothetical protein AALP_AA1G298200 [Arabis alpina]
MKETIRCCIACILPCGSLDVIRIVHSNGHVEEISGTITAREIMKAHPKHVLKKPSSPPSDHDDRDDVISATKIVIVPPEAELQRGKIYFLMPAGTKIRSAKTNANADANANAKKRSQNRRRREDGNDGKCSNDKDKDKDCEKGLTELSSDRYLTEILSEKVATQKDRRKGRVGVWRPHLESISESLSED